MNFIYEKNKVYVENEDGKNIILATFPKFNEDTVVINHTYVDPSLRGEGVASKLMYATCEYIKKQGFKIVATCPYAIVWFEKHHEYDDIVDLEVQLKLSPVCQR
ncbi:MAG: GNAT family N-acetyltransferase [Acholeplasmataceae bacterium]